MFSETPPGAIKKPSFRPALNCPRLSSMSLRWGSSSFHIVGADTRDLRGPKRTVLWHGTIRSRRSVDRSCPGASGNGLYWCAHVVKVGWPLATKALKQSNAIGAILNLICHGRRTVGVTSTSSRWVNVSNESRAEPLTGERIITCHTSSMKLHGSCRAADLYGERRRQHALSTKNSASLSALMPVEADAGFCHVTRLIKITARARGHTIFRWSTIVTILHCFQNKPHND